MNTRRWLFVIFILFILVRLPYLDQLNLLHDERDIVLSGFSIARTGNDLFGNPFPLVFQNISPNNPLFAIYFSAFWFLFIPIKTVFLARLPFVLVSSMLVFIFFKIIKLITRDDKKSLITTALLCFNPWIFHITRLALDIPLAAVFLFGGILFYLEKKKLLALYLFFLTAFTYQGSRLLIPFLLIYLEVFFLIKDRSRKSFFMNSIKNLFFIVFLIVLATLMEPSISKNRLSEIIFFNNVKNAQTVDFKRLTSIAPLYVSRFFDNKLTVAIDEVMSNFTKGLDPNYLFKNGDFSAINGNAVTGQFFFIFILFYFLGFISLGRRFHKSDLYLLGFIPLGMLPALISTQGLSFSIRGILSSIGFSYLIALGILFSFELLKKQKLKYYALVTVFIILFINVGYFIYGYYFRRPVTVGEMFNENERQLSEFLSKKNNFTIYHSAPQDMLFSYFFFANTKLDLAQIQANLHNKEYSYNDLKILKCNHKVNYLQTNNVILHEACLDIKTYDILSDINNKKVKTRIPYRDFSQRYAYFVIE